MNVLAREPRASIGIAFENGSIRLAAVVDLTDLHILEMSAEEMQSPQLLAELRKRDAAAKRISSQYANISVVTVVDTKGEIFHCILSTDDGRPRPSFGWGGHKCTSEPDYVAVGRRIQNHTLYVRAVHASLLTFHEAVAELPLSKH